MFVLSMIFILSHQNLGSLEPREKEFRLKRCISQEEINLSSRQKYGFYLFGKSFFYAKHII